MKKTRFLAAMLAVVLATPVMAADYTLTDNSTETSYSFPSGNTTTNHLRFNIAGDEDKSISTAAGITIGTQSGTADVWVGTSSNITDSNSTINMSGAISGQGKIQFNAWSDNNHFTLYNLSGSASDFSGTLRLDDGVGTGTMQLNIVDNASSYREAIIEAKDNGGRFILNLSKSTTLGGLKGGKVTSTNAANTLTLHLTADASTGGDIGAVNNNGYYASASATSKTNSALLNLVKEGSAKQSFTGAINVGTITLNAGTLEFGSNSASATGLTVANGTLAITAGKTLTVKSLTLNGGIINGAGTLAINNSNRSENCISADLSKISGDTTLWLEQVKGGLTASTGTIAADIKLRNGAWAGAEWTSANRSDYTFTGNFSNGGTGDNSTGNFGITEGIKNITFTFEGDMAAWTGILRSKSGSTMNVNIGGSLETAVGANIQKNSGTLALNVKRNTSFTNSVDATSVSIDANMVVSSTHDTFNAGSVALASGSSLTLQGANRTFGSLTLGSGATITLGSSEEGQHDFYLGTTGLTVNGDATMNANLVMNSGRMDFTSGGILTMGCTVYIGNDVTVVLSQDMVDAIAQGQWVEIIASVEGTATLGSSMLFTGDNFELAQPEVYHLEQINDKIYIAPEPATATLSLLALAALASRRKRR